MCGTRRYVRMVGDKRRHGRSLTLPSASMYMLSMICSRPEDAAGAEGAVC